MPKAAAEPGPDLFKDRFNHQSITIMAAALRQAYPKFDAEGFTAAVVTDAFLTLEFKARVTRIADTLADFLPKIYGKAIDVLIKAAPNVGGFENWAMITFLERHGLEHFDESIRGLKALTRYSSGESAIRPYLNRYLDRMLPILHQWADDPDEHVRRLAAEGSRPRGVWIEHITAFKKDPQPVLELLEKLKADPARYVQKAVANNLNDISKDHPDIVIKTALRWKAEGNGVTDWIVRHGCRTLIKKGDPRVFPIFGFTPNPKVAVERLRVPKAGVAIGKTAEFPFTLRSEGKTKQKLAIDYRLHYVKASGKTSPKVFKLVERTIAPGETLDLRVKQSFADVSIRKHFPGEHCIEIIVNGTVAAKTLFKLKGSRDPARPKKSPVPGEG